MRFIALNDVHFVCKSDYGFSLAEGFLSESGVCIRVISTSAPSPMK
jgi:hypothetical protein